MSSKWGCVLSILYCYIWAWISDVVMSWKCCLFLVLTAALHSSDVIFWTCQTVLLVLNLFLVIISTVLIIIYQKSYCALYFVKVLIVTTSVLQYWYWHCDIWFCHPVLVFMKCFCRDSEYQDMYLHVLIHIYMYQDMYLDTYKYCNIIMRP